MWVYGENKPGRFRDVDVGMSGKACLSTCLGNINVVASCPQAVKLAAAYLSSSLVLTFAFLSPAPACFGSDPTLVPQCNPSKINILYDGNIVWVCDKACQHTNEASWH